MKLDQRPAAPVVSRAPGADPKPHALAEPVDLRFELRRATSALHARVDQVMPLSRPAPTLADYLDHLMALHAWLAALAGALPPAPWLLREQQALRADAASAARWMGGAPLAPALAAPGPITDRLRRLAAGTEGAAAVLGVRYVIEGSHLGGQVLRRQLAQRLAPHPLAYLDQAAGRWPAFLRELAGERWTHAQRRSACDAAVLAFELLLALTPAPERVA